jgi:hypothetical protein
MNKKGFFVFLALFVAVMYFTYGCGTTTETTTTTTRATGNVSISGKIASTSTPISSVSSANGTKILATAGAALENYTVAAVGKSTGQIYFSSTKTDSAGNFTISNLPSGESYYLELLDSTNKLVAPVSMGTTGGKAVMAITPESSSTINLGQIAYNSTQGAAAPTVEPTSLLDKSTSVEAKAGTTLVPTGAGNYGKGSGTQTSTYNSNVADGDKDGLPNIVDADNNGDLVVDEFDGQSTREVIYTTTLPDYFVYAFTNLKIDYDRRDTFKTTYSDFTIAIGLTPNVKGGSTKTVSSVKITEGPAWIARALLTTRLTARALILKNM